jgi:hypothetical protein
VELRARPQAEVDLDHVAKMDADAKPGTALGRQASVALDRAVLHFDGAAHGIHHAAKLDEDAIARPLNDPAVMQSDGGVEQIAAERPQPRQRSLLVGSGQPAVSGDIGRQNGREFASFRHGRARWVSQSSTPTRSGMAV